MNRETPKLGILGAGQLAQMLVQEALELGISVTVLADSPGAPAAQLAVDRVMGTDRDEGAIRELLSRVDLVLFENEFVDVDLLEKASRGWTGRFVPGLPVIRVLQDKLEQKKLFCRLQIPSAPFIEREGSLPAFLQECEARFPGGYVLKWARLGYDGKGVRVVRPGEPGKNLPELMGFCENAQARGIAVYGEQRVEFRRELAMVGVGRPGGMDPYPLVVSEQERGVCKKVFGKATALGVSPSLEPLAESCLRKLASELNITGVFAIEFFETAQGELWVNEAAPRVHNSGHYTQEASQASQFRNHVLAAAGRLLESRESSSFFGMLNLLGSLQPGEAKRTTQGFPQPPSVPAWSAVHWYGKSEIRPGRKMGHINFSASSGDELRARMAELERIDLEWQKEQER